MGTFANDGTATKPSDMQWWKREDDDGLAQATFAAANAILSNNAGRQDIIWRNLQMYSGQSRDNYWSDNAQNPLALSRGASSSPYKVNRNVVASVADTIVSLLSSTTIKTTILSDGGDYSRTRKKSQAAEDFCEGVKYNNQFELLAPLTLLAAIICDLGIIKVEEDPEKPETIKLSDVFTPELIVDELAGMKKAPRELQHRKAVSREVLLAKYKDEVEDLQSFLDSINPIGSGMAEQQGSDLVEVLESWHLPTGPDTHDGLHVIALENVVLLKEEWTASHFPFAFLRPNLSMFGMFGQGIASDLVGIQYEINQLSAAKQRALYLGSNFMVMVPTGSKINKNHLLNGMGLVLEYTGEAPSWFTPSPVSPNIESEISGLISWSYQRWGVSQLTAQSLKPEGLDSGEALRTMANIQSVRHSTLGKAYQRFHMDVDFLILMTARMIDERMKRDSKKAKEEGREAKASKLMVRAPDEQHIKHISWDDADPGDGFMVKMYPTNALADNPADRIAQLGDLSQKGLIDQETFLDVMPFPDMKALNRLRSAPRENILKQIDDILIDGKYRSPEPFQNLQMGCTLMQSALLDAETRGDVGDDKIRLLSRWIGEAKALLNPPLPPPPAPTPGMGPGLPPPMPLAAPQAMPMPAPGAPLPPPPGGPVAPPMQLPPTQQ